MEDMLRDFIKTNSLWVYIIIATTFLAVLVAIFCLSHGFNDFFPYFFLVPMLLVIYAFPRKGVISTVVMGWIYIILVYVFGTFSVRVIAVHTAWFFYLYLSWNRADVLC